MTIPVARTHVRRNVRMAVALVVGQAVLCIVIGYIALGGPGSHLKATPQAVGPLAAPTTEAAPPTTDGPSSRTPSPSGQPPPPGAPGDARIVPATIAAPTNPADAPQILEGPPADAPQILDAPPDTTTAPSLTPSDTKAGTPTDNQDVAKPQTTRTEPDATLGEPCDKARASGVTSDGVDVVCLADSQGNLVWQLPKQPRGQAK